MTAHAAGELPLSQPAATVVAGHARPRRIYITGGPGSGKTTLATRIATVSGLPVHHLDDIARVGGGEGRLRTAEERAPLMEAILAADAWISEGVQLDWTEPLMERAQVIVWLDYVAWPGAAGRMVRRFVSGAVHEMRTRPGRQKVARVGDYARSLAALFGALGQSRRYYHGADGSGTAHGDLPAPISETLDSHAATLAALGPYRAKLVWCRSAADIEAFMSGLGDAVGQPS